MRRISMALALVGAVAAAGCGGSSKPSSTNGTKGTGDGTFTIKVNAQGSGSVTLDPADKFNNSVCSDNTDCVFTYAASTAAVSLTASTGQIFNGWFGDCQGTGSCTLTGIADKYVVAFFSASAQGHPNWAHGWDHGPRYEASQAGVPGELQCAQCHGANLAGQSIAPACNTCHYFNGKESVLPEAPSAQVMHFDSSAGAWDTSPGAHFLGNDCIRCHTNSGFSRWISSSSYLGSPAGTFVPAFAYVAGTDLGGPLKCETCHANNVLFGASPVTKILFPSGATVTAPDVATAVCGQCHMGRNSTAGVDATTGMAGAADVVPATNISFPDEHYLSAAATLYGGVAKGWYQYSGHIYTGQNEHGGVGSCVYCHEPHNGQLPADGTGDMKRLCGKCHFDEKTGQPVSTFAQLEESRQFGFEGDIDGDGTVESIKGEIDGLAAKLAAAMSAYANQYSSTTNGMCFSGAAYPYWYQKNASGACLDGIAATPKTSFAKFTPRLVRAAYNYKQYVKEPGAWAHNPRYVIEVLFDSITDLNSALTAKVPFSGLRTTTQGHFGAATAAKPLGSDAFTDWNAAGQIDAACSQCHGAKTGLTNFIANQATALMTPSIVAFECLTCHAPVGTAANFKGVRTDITTLYFPPAKTAANANQIQLAATVFPYAKDRICATCHTGRENMTTIDLAINGKLAGNFSVSFKNPHYLGAAGVLFGSNTHMMYEYTGKSYATYPAFWGSGRTNGAAPGPFGSPHGGSCTGCHNPQGSRHGFEIDLATSMPAGSTTTCNGCHVVEPGVGDFRLEPVKANVGALAAELLAKINAYQVANGQNPVCYAGGAYPYWYVGSVHPGGVCDATEITGYGSKWDAKTAKAVYNFQWSQKEPGAYAHNWDYIAQTLIDSITDLDASATLPCDAHDSLCLAPQLIEGSLIAGGPAYTGSSFIVRP